MDVSQVINSWQQEGSDPTKRTLEFTAAEETRGQVDALGWGTIVKRIVDFAHFPQGLSLVPGHGARLS